MKVARTSWRSQGFTLVEIMVAVVILVLLAILVTAMTNATGSAIRLSNEASATDSDARLAFDRIGLDLAGVMLRSDVDFWAGNPSSRDSSTLLLFLSSVDSDGTSESIAPGNNRYLSIVGYQIATNANNANLPCLVRAGKAIGWSGNTSKGFMGLDSNGLPVPFPNALLPATTDYDVLASGVIRMVVGFQLYPDNKSITSDDGNVAFPHSAGQIIYSPPVLSNVPPAVTSNHYVDINRISAIVIGLVVIDNNALKLVNTSQITTIASQFGIPNTNQLPVQSWGSTLDTLASNLTGSVPKPALQSVRIYERVYPISLNATTAPAY